MLSVAGFMVALCLIENRFADADAWSTRAVLLAPQGVNLQVNRLAVLTARGFGTGAVEGLRESLRPAKPLSDSAIGARHAFLARALFDTGDTSGARHHAEEAQRLGVHRPILTDVWRRLDQAAGTWAPPNNP